MITDTKETNEELIQKARNGDKWAYEDLFKNNQNLIKKVVSKWQGMYHDNDELYSIAQYAMLKAYIAFDLSKNIKFSTYAMNAMNNHIINFFRQMNLTKKRKNNLLSLDMDNKSGHGTLKDLIVDEINFNIENAESDIIVDQIIDEFKEQVDDEKFFIVHQLYYGKKNQSEVSKTLKRSRSYVTQNIKKSKVVMRPIIYKHLGYVFEGGESNVAVQ